MPLFGSFNPLDLVKGIIKTPTNKKSETLKKARDLIAKNNYNRKDYSKQYSEYLDANFSDYYNRIANDQSSQFYVQAFDDRGHIDPKVVAELAGGDPKKVSAVLDQLHDMQLNYERAGFITQKLQKVVDNPAERRKLIEGTEGPGDFIKNLVASDKYLGENGLPSIEGNGLGALGFNAHFDRLFDPEQGGIDLPQFYNEVSGVVQQESSNTAAQQNQNAQERHQRDLEEAQKAESLGLLNEYKQIYEQEAVDQYDFLTKQLGLELPAIEEAYVAQITALDNRIRNYELQRDVNIADIREDFQLAVDNAYTVFDRNRDDINLGFQRNSAALNTQFDRNKSLLDRNFNRAKVSFENRLDDRRGVARRHRGDNETALNNLMLQNEQTLQSKLRAAGLQGGVADTAKQFELLEQAERTANVRENYQESIQVARNEYNRNLGLATEDYQTDRGNLREDYETATGQLDADRDRSLLRNQKDYDSSKYRLELSKDRNLRDFELQDSSSRYGFNEERRSLDVDRQNAVSETKRSFNERLAANYNNLGQQIFNTSLQAGLRPLEAQERAKDALNRGKSYRERAAFSPGTQQKQYIPLRFNTNVGAARDKGRFNQTNVGQDYREGV